MYTYAQILPDAILWMGINGICSVPYAACFKHYKSLNGDCALHVFHGSTLSFTGPHMKQALLWVNSQNSPRDFILVSFWRYFYTE